MKVIDFESVMRQFIIKRFMTKDKIKKFANFKKCVLWIAEKVNIKLGVSQDFMDPSVVIRVISNTEQW